MDSGFTHFDKQGNARMVDVGDKDVTARRALAKGTIYVGETIFSAVTEKTVKKGDVLTVAQVAGIQGAKRTSELIPLCHVLPLDGVKITFEMDREKSEITAYCEVKNTGRTGVEMEALTGVSTALLTIYDMCKALDHGMVIRDIHLEEKSGGKSGEYRYSKE